MESTVPRPTRDAAVDAPSLRDRWSIVNRLTRQIRLHVVIVAGAAFVAGLIEAGFLVTVARTALAIADGSDQITLTRNVTVSVGSALGIAAVILLVRLVMELASVRVQMGLSFRITTSLRKQLARAYLRSSWAVQQRQPSGALTQVVVNFPSQATSLVNTLVTATGAAISLLALVTVAVVIDPLATLVIIVALAVLTSVLRPLRLAIHRRSRSMVARNVEFATGVSEMGDLGLEIQSFGVADQAESRLERLIDNEAVAARNVGLLTSASTPIYVSLAYGALLVALVIVSAVAGAALASVGTVMLVMLRTLGYGQVLQRGSVSFAQLLPFLDEMDARLAEFAESPATNGTATIERISEIRFDDVAFAYEPGHDVLAGISLEITPGEVVGIIGPSGAGKTTLVQLLLGVREPSRGSIRCGSTPLADIDRRSWTRLVAFVPQDPMLITGTIAENIALYRTGFSTEQYRGAARAAHLLEEIDSLPDGFDTDLGKRARQLSGGQRQRLAIARALVGDPQLIILDEPTSALDPQAESVIRETIGELAGRATVVVIAHRLSTLAACDRLIVIQDGHVVADGSPASLARDSTFYQEALRLAEIR